jgi:hypothetical protein
MADTTPRARDDTPAVGAYAKHHGLDAEAAAEEWRFLAEKRRAHWREIADPRPTAATPGQAVYERWHALLRQRFPGIAPIAWDELGGEAHAEWEDIARTGVAAAVGLSQSPAADSDTALYLSAISRLSAGLRDVQHACERGDTPSAIVSVAAGALADVGKLQLPQVAG